MGEKESLRDKEVTNDYITRANICYEKIPAKVKHRVKIKGKPVKRGERN